jgi:transcriptional regulator with XRE-family HTH domain
MARNSAPDEISPEFPEKLKKARIVKGLTQGQLARKIGADTQRVSKYERGVAAPTTALLVKLAEALDVTTDYLIRGGATSPASSIADPELLERFQHISDLPEQDQTVLISVIDAFIKKRRFESVAAS